MEAVVFIGLQGAGKSTFYRERFFATHLRINLDMLKTRHRERRFLQTCIETGQPFVVDNTNPTRAERQVYVEAAKQAGFRVIGYYFQSKVEDCKRRNEQRPVEERIPVPGILGAAGRLQIPGGDEGFDDRRTASNIGAAISHQSANRPAEIKAKALTTHWSRQTRSNV